MSITDFLQEFEKIDNWGNAAKTAACCLGFGYVWKSIKLKWMPNEAIPPAVMLFGAGLFTALSAYETEYIQAPGWYLSSAVTGFTVGFVTVLGHNYIVKYAEDFVLSKLKRFMPEPETKEPKKDEVKP